MKLKQIINHGTLIDTINYEGLFYAQANQETFQGNRRKVVRVKVRNKAKAYSKVKKPSQRHR